MSLVIGHENPDNLKVSPTVVAKGINKLQCVLSDVVYHGFATVHQIAYGTYVKLLPAFMKANETQRPVKAKIHYQPCAFPIANCFPYSYPNISVAFPTPPPTAVMDVLKGHGFEELVIKGKKVCLFRDPTLEVVQTIMSIPHNDTCPAPNTFVNTSCLRSIALVRRVLSAFLLTQVYAAFVDANHANEVEENYKVEFKKGKRAAADNSRSGPSSKRPRRESEFDVTMGTGEEGEIAEPDETILLGSEDIHVAHPSNPNLTTPGWGGLAQIPSGNGIFVPYVPELMLADTKILIRVLVEHFGGCLGSSVESIRHSIDQIKSSWGLVAYTRVGQMLNQIAFCVDLAIKTQSRCFPIFEGETFEGCVISGYNFHIIFGPNVYTPVTSSELVSIIDRFGTTRSTIRAIANVAGLVDDDEIGWEDGSIKLTTMMKLVRKLREARMTNESRDEVVKLAFNLRQVYFGISPDKICLTLERMVLPLEEVLKLDIPVHPSMLFSDDPVALLWSSFGDMAPSPYFPNQPKFSLASTKLPGHINFTNRVLSQAISEIHDILRSQEITIGSTNRRTRIFKDRVYEKTAAQNIFAAFRRAANTTIAPAGGTSGAGVPTENVTGSVNLFDAF